MVDAFLVSMQRVRRLLVQAVLEVLPVRKFHQPVGAVQDRRGRPALLEHGKVRVVLIHVRVIADEAAELPGGHHSVLGPPLRDRACLQPRLPEHDRPLRCTFYRCHRRVVRLQIDATLVIPSPLAVAPPEPFVVLLDLFVLRRKRAALVDGPPQLAELRPVFALQ